jgi:choline-sulfatase
MDVQQRMIRQGRHKLVYYHGYPPQLFDLADDPREERDVAGLPRYAAVRQQLTRRLLAEWDPELIARRMRTRRHDKDLLAAWARATRPEDSYRWPLTADQNRLEPPAG